MTQHEFEHFLRCLHPDRDQAGAAYNRLRAALIQDCARRKHHAPEDGADATLDRAATRLAAGLAVPAEQLAGYCKEIARYVCLEAYRRRLREQAAELAHGQRPTPPSETEIEAASRQRQHCLEQLEAAAQRTLRAYCLPGVSGAFADIEAARERLAAELGLSLQTLRVRVHRWRQRLEKCLRARPQNF